MWGGGLELRDLGGTAVPDDDHVVVLRRRAERELTDDAVAGLGTDVVLHAYEGEGHGFSRGAEARMREELFGWLSATARR